MQPRKISPVDQAKIARIEKETGIPSAQLERAALGQITLSREDLHKILAANLPLPEGIKKPFGN